MSSPEMGSERIATEYQVRRAQIWLLQVRKKGTNQAWCATSPRYFYSREEVKQYITSQIALTNFEYLEYRPMRYVPARY